MAKSWAFMEYINLQASEIRQHKFVVGTNQTIKAVKAGKALKAFVASDASDYMKKIAFAACEEASVPCDAVASMSELGKCCGIARGAVCAAVVNH
jgi:large subunit ribosomal protein L7A